MNSEHFSPVLPPLEPIAVESQKQSSRIARQEQRALDHAVSSEAKLLQDQSAAASKMEQLDSKIRLGRHLGNVALGNSSVESDPTGPNGELPKVLTRRERRLDKKIDSRVREQKYAIGKDFVTNPRGSGNLGKKRRIATGVRTLGVRFNTDLSAGEKAIALRESKSEPIRKRSKHQKRSTLELQQKTVRVEEAIETPSLVRKRDKATDEVKQSHLKKEEAIKKQQLLKVSGAFRDADSPVLEAKRDYNATTKQVNSERKKYIKGVKRSARMDRLIDRINPDTTNRVAGMVLARAHKSRDASELKVQGAERRGADLRVAARSKKQTVAEREQVAEQKKQDIKNYLESIEPERPVLSSEQAISALSYSNVLPIEQRQEAIESIRNSPSGVKYSESLRDLTSKHGLEAIFDTANELVVKAETELNKLGLVPSIFGKSSSWALWDIAKQNYFVNHPAEADPNYSIADPMEDQTKLEEVLDRHIGWELFRAFNGTSINKSEKARLLSDRHITNEVKTYLQKEPKPGTNDLSSKDLAALGRLIRLG